MSRYTDLSKVRLALRAPGPGSGTKWDDDTYTELINAAIATAEEKIDSLCEGWAPFDSGSSTDDVSIIARGEAMYQELLTPPFTVKPTSVTGKYPGSTDAGQTVELNFDPVISVQYGMTKIYKNLSFYGRTPIREGVEYTFSGGSWLFPTIPDSIGLAAQRMGVKYFISSRNSLGIVEVGDGVVYEPRMDGVVMAWLSNYLSGEVV